MEPNSLEFLSSQVALGFEKPIFSPENHFEKINEKLGGIFGGSAEITITPVPFVGNDRELLDTPVVQAISEDKRYQLNIARGRVDFFRNAKQSEKSFLDTKSDFLAKIGGIVDATVDAYPVKWTGFVVAYIYTNVNYADLSLKVINPDLVNLNEGETNSFFLRNTNKINVGEVLSNNLIAIGSGNANKDQRGLVDGLLINQDFNTKPSDNLAIDQVFIKKYIEESEKMLGLDKLVSLISST